MSDLSKLLGIAAVGASIAKARLVQCFVRDLASVIALAIATGFIIGALLISVFYIAYQGLVRNGLDPFVAQILVTGFGLFALVTLLGMTSARLKRMRSIPGQIIHSEFPMASRLNGLADSFIDGFLKTPAPASEKSL